jgi:glutathione reductase (NADPH)
MDADAVACLQAKSERVGLQIRTGVGIERIEATGGRFRVIFTCISWNSL